jgi:nucleotide-binding universal stress UspA family protein
MSTSIGPGFSIIQSVLHPTDFSEASRVAFHHALKTAMLSRSQFTLLHVSSDRSSAWSDFPGVRETLERWGVLPSGSAKSDVAKLGIEVRKVMATEKEPVEAVINYEHDHQADLIVLATSQRDGRVRWLGSSVAEPVTRKAGEMTLLIPGDAEGFVDAANGAVKLNKILIPIAQTPSPQPALKMAARLVEHSNSTAGTFVVAHVGTANTMPATRYPEVPGWEWQKDLRSGPVIEGIVNAAKEHEADLIVMATDGRNGFLDGIRGSHSERVLRTCATPLMTVPITSRISRYLT